jgi:hypothetical protein
VLAAHKRSEPESADPRQFTTIEIDPLFPPLCDVCAVIVTVPDLLPLTSPVADTVAVLVLELNQTKL